MTPVARPASPEDAERIAQIYNEGIEDRVGTFETRPRSADDVRAWFDGIHPIVVVGTSRRGDRLCVDVELSRARMLRRHRGILGVCDARARGVGAGTVAMQALIEAAAPAGIWKLVSRIFVENTASRKLMASMGFREVGIYDKHAQLDGQWRDVVIVERLIPENAI